MRRHPRDEIEGPVRLAATRVKTERRQNGWQAGGFERTEGHERLALHAAQDLLKTTFIVEFPGHKHRPVSHGRREVAIETQWGRRDVVAYSFSSKDEGSGRPDTGLVMMECGAAE